MLNAFLFASPLSIQKRFLLFVFELSMITSSYETTCVFTFAITNIEFYW